ncbi:MAG TPA: hypothetical protein VD996_00985, partial [Chitinophagaceae bacterium]|nr:hypothetical protein [Chitinophagaceae bacterium]
MERNFYNDDFERLIRQKADQYKMYPSDQVWKGVYKSLHGRKRWRWAGLAILLLSIGSYTGNWYFSGKPAGRLANNIQPSISAANQQFPQENTAGRSQAYTQPQQAEGHGNSDKNTPAYGITVNTTYVNSPGTQQGIISPANDAQSLTVLENRHPPLNTAQGDNSFLIVNEPAQTIMVDEESELPLKGRNAQTAPDNKSINTSLADAASESVLAGTKKQNWLEEMALFQLAPQKPKRFGVQMYFSPTVNYRKLSGSATFPSSAKSIPLAADIQGDVDQYVKHKPALGVELGTNILYRASRRINVKAGLQFNYSRYNIEAFATQPEVATIALSNSQAFLADTISTVSTIRNLSGYAQEDLSNQYFQL